MKRISLLIIALAFVTDGFSQFDLLKDLDYKNERKDTTNVKPPFDSIEVSKPIDQFTEGVAAYRFPDVSNFQVEYYQHIVNKYGLWKGIGNPLSETQRKHLPTCYKLMRAANAAPNSPFTHMQIVDFAGKLTNNLSYRPYLGGDNGLTEEWDKKLKEICQAEKIISKGMLIQENLYDKNGELVLQYIPSYVSDERIVGHYIDCNGIMPKFRKNDESTYIGIKFDSNGYFQQIYFYDKDGNMTKNEDGAYSTLYEYDANGNQIASMSGDSLGRPTIDNWGNCGFKYTYDKQGRMHSATCIDDKGNPMKMPTIKEGASGVWRTKYKYDNWGNETERAYFDNYGRPDVNPKGIHKILYTYNRHGQPLTFRAEGLNHELVNYGRQWATYERTYDKDGNETSIVLRDKDEKPFYKRVRHPEIDSIFHYDDGYMNLTWKRGKPTDEDYTISRALLYFDKLGDIGRTSRADASYFKFIKTTDVKGETLSIQSFNEFDEPAYIWFGEDSYRTILCYTDAENNFFDENGDTIDSYSSLKEKLYKSYSIELIDSVGYHLGLRTGDLIVQYGDWIYAEPSTEDVHNLNLLCYETVAKACYPKTITLIRHEPKSKSSRLISIELPKGTPSELGFIYHKNYMTSRETERYRNIIANFGFSASNTKFEQRDEIFLFFPKKIDSNRRSVFDGGFRDNAIILAWDYFEKGKSYLFTYDSEDIEADNPFSCQCDSIALHYTLDGKSVQRYVFKNSIENDVQIFRERISDGTVFTSLSHSLKASLEPAQFEPETETIALEPIDAAEQLLGFNGSRFDCNSWFLTWWYDDEYINHSDICNYKVNRDSLSISEMLCIKHMISNLDYSNYAYLEYLQDDNTQYDYIQIDKNKITRVLKVSDFSITFILGDNIFIPHKTLPVIKIRNSSQDEEETYVALQYGSWRLGMPYPDAFNKSLSGPCEITVAKLPKEGGTLGRRKTITLTSDFIIQNEEVSDMVYFETLKKTTSAKMSKLAQDQLNGRLEKNH